MNRRDIACAVLFITVLLLTARDVVAQAPTAVIARTIEFDVDLNNYMAKLPDRITDVVTRAQFDVIGMNGDNAVVLTVDLGKPPASPSGHIGPIFVPQLGALMRRHEPYRATVTLIGPNGRATSAPSAPFMPTNRTSNPIAPIQLNDITIR
ncbi:MAG TPA: hypothetical protein VF456_07210 [Vicinamibacterales bacterium]